MFTPDSFKSSNASQISFIKISDINDLKNQLNYCIQEQFTGQLDLHFENSQQWTLHFHLGSLFWGAGGLHPNRRWCRQLHQYCPNLAVDAHKQSEDWPLYLDYGSLRTLLAEGKVQSSEVKSVVNGLIVEILFDVLQQWAYSSYASELTLLFKYNHADSVDSSWVKTSVYSTLSQAVSHWRAWQECGLIRYSPNQAPTIVDAEKLQEQLLPNTYQNLARLMTGERTLRDIAIKLSKDPLTIAKSLIPHIHNGLINLVDINDLRKATRLLLPASQANGYQYAQPTAPLIAHIDDSKIEGQAMERIITSMGYQFLHIEETIQSFPLLLKHEPRLIFLDLIMPIINGYEACAQIRRISKLQDTPIVILTSKDGVIDRVRAKLSGSTDFLTKPITPKKIQSILQKYLGMSYQLKAESISEAATNLKQESSLKENTESRQ